MALISSQRNELRQSLSFFQKSIQIKKISEQDINALIDVITVISSCAMRMSFALNANQKKDLCKSYKLLSIVHEIKNEFDAKYSLTTSQEFLAQRSNSTYLRAIKSKILSICQLLNGLDELKTDQETSSMKLSLRHRQEYLVEQDNLSQVINSSIDCYYKISQEYFYSSSLIKQVIPESILKLNNNRFCQKTLRVPYIALSKYHNSDILQHQFIRSKDGWLSLDSQEELVSKEDKIWYFENLRCLLKEFLFNT